MQTEMQFVKCFIFTFLCSTGVHVTSGITVNIPDKEYKIARGEIAMIPCTFTPSATITTITWTAEADVPGEPEVINQCLTSLVLMLICSCVNVL